MCFDCAFNNLDKILTNFNHGTLVTTAAKRITVEAGNIPVMEFGARRARGNISAIEASKYAYVGGCFGTSNTKSNCCTSIFCSAVTEKRKRHNSYQYFHQLLSLQRV